MEPASLRNTGSTTFVISVQLPPAEMMTVPGAITSPSGYFCFMDSESLPVGILMPSATAKSEQPCTASYRRASSPSLLQAHIQLADRDTPASPFLMGAKTRFDKASPMAFRDPATGSMSAESGACPIVVATPSVER